MYVGCGNTFAKQEQRGFESWLKKKSRQEWQLDSPAREYLEQVKMLP